MIAFKEVSKRFGSVVANDKVSFEIQKGTFHALLGENGAGKTTLMRMLAGELHPDLGTIYLEGRKQQFRSPLDARNVGIRLVHQHPALIPSFTIVENFALDDARGRFLTDFKSLAYQLQTQALAFGVKLDPFQPVCELPYAQQQWLEVFRAVFGESRILILDEPTASLSPLEGDALLRRVKQLTATGVSVILITHKMREVFEFADSVTVLRKGEAVATHFVRDVNTASLTEMMVREVDCLQKSIGERNQKEPNVGEQLIEVRKLSCVDRRGKRILNSVTFELHRNQILGVAGVAGNGQTELARIVAGLDSNFEGAVRPVSNTKLSISYIPDDRIHVATAAKLSVQENLTLRDFANIPCASRGFLKRNELARLAQERVTRFGIKVASLTSPLSVLSGGNIQRVVVARELASKADLVIAHNPTAGLDLSTCHFVQAEIVAAAVRGACILLISDDLDELVALSDKVLVLHNGCVGGTLKGTEISAVKIAGLMAGGESTLAVSPARNLRTTDAQPQEGA